MSPLFLFTLLIPEIIVHDVSFAFIRVKQVKYSLFHGRWAAEVPNQTGLPQISNLWEEEEVRQAKLACEFLLASHFRRGPPMMAKTVFSHKGGVRTLADYPRAPMCAYAILYGIQDSHFWWGPHKFSIFWESGSSSRLMTQASFIATCLLNANRLPIPYCALRSQHLLSQMHSLSIIPELYSGTFPPKKYFY